MGKFTNFIKSAKTLLSKEIRSFDGSNITPKENLAFLPVWYFSSKLGVPRRVNIQELRQYEKSAWVQMILNTITRQLMTIEWDIVNSDEEDEKDYSVDIKKIKSLLNFPNRNGDTFWDVWSPFIRDVASTDSGVVLKGRNVNGEIVELFSYDGSRFLVNVNQFGIIGEDENGEKLPGYYQYSFLQPSLAPVPFDKNDIVYGRINTNTELYPYGWSPLQSILQEVELMIQSTKYNKEFFINNATPDGIVSVPMEREQMEDFKNEWELEIKGKPHKLLFHNSEASFTPLSSNNKDMEWLAGQKWYFHVVFGAYGLSPQEVGYYENSNKSTGESQERITIKNAIKPYLQLISSKINREILPEVVGHDKIKFKWFPKDDVAEKLEHEQTMGKLINSVLTINEVRCKEGLQPVEWGDRPLSMQMTDSNKADSKEDDDKSGNGDKEDSNEDNNGNKEDSKEDRDSKKDERDKNKSIEKSVLSGDDIIDEADNYVDMLRSQFNKWEKTILNSINPSIYKSYTTKSFGDFLSTLFNTVYSTSFFSNLKRVIRISLKEGISSMEDKLEMDLGVGVDFEKQVKILADREIDGFTINGKRWHGLKGVSKDLQNSVSTIVGDGINVKKSPLEIKNDIKTLFTKYSGGEVDGEVTEGRAMKIARTESNRFINYGKLDGMKSSGIDGKKQWSSFLDDKTSDVCKSLHGQTVDLNDNFVDPNTGIMYDVPPALPNCRSTIDFIFD